MENTNIKQMAEGVEIIKGDTEVEKQKTPNKSGMVLVLILVILKLMFIGYIIHGAS